jgi:type IX secretion system PorP/SprF family membrane protein
MKQSYKILLVAICAVLGISELKAQDPEFTQFYANPLYLNPALAGNRICPRVNINYRMQWPGIYGTYSTVGVSLDRLVSKIQGGVGIMVMQDRAGKGTLNTTGIGLIYAPKKNITHNLSVSAAIQVGYWQKQVNWSKLTFGDMIDPYRGFTGTTQEVPNVQTVGNFDLAAGMVINTRNFYAGGAIHHILEPNESFLGGTSILPRKYTLHAGGIISLNKSYNGEESYISPNILYQAQGDFKQLNLGVYVKKGPIVGGLWYRGNDSFIVLLGMEANSFRIGYSYDVTISKLSNATAGSHEISLGYNFSCKPPRKVYRPAMCPSF